MARRRRGKRGQDEETTLEIGMGALVAILLLVGSLMAGLAWWLGAAGAPLQGGPTAADRAPLATVVPERGTWTTAEGDPAIGARNAPVTIVEYSDYQCPNCRQFATEVLPWLKESWMADGFVRVIYRDFAIRGPASVAAAAAAHCAAEQGRYWSYHDTLFAAQSGPNQRTFDRENLVAMAAELGLDTGAFAACVDSGRYRAKVEQSTQFGHSQGFEGTPTFVINGRTTQGAIGIADWEQLFRLYQQDFARATEAAP